MRVNRVEFYNKGREDTDFEIVKIKQFFNTRPKKLIENNYRLNFWSLIYITEGKGKHSIDFKEYPYKAGDLIVISKNQVHSYRVNYEVRGYIININEPFFTEDDGFRDMDMIAFLDAPFGKPILQIDTAKSSTSRQIIDLIYKEYMEDSEYSKKLIKSLFTSLAYSIRNETIDNIRKFSLLSYKHYYEYRELVEQNFTVLKTVVEYERLMGLNKKTINLVCRECAGITAKDLITNRIILEVKRLIAQGKLKNFEISEAVGFDEPANLAGFFKRYTGKSMREFRNTVGQ